MAMEKCQVQFGLVEYRDHPPEDTTFVTRVHPLTSSISKMKKYVDHMRADGGTVTTTALCNLNNHSDGI